MTALALLALVPIMVFIAATFFVMRPFAALAVLAAVVPFGSTIAFPTPPPFDNLSSLIGGLAVAAFAGHLTVISRCERPGPAPAVWALLTGVAALTTLWSLTPSSTLTGVAVMISLLLLYVLVSMTPPSRSDLNLLEIGAVISGVVVGVYAIYLAGSGALSGAFDQRFVAAIGGSETGDVADPNITAASMLLPFFIAANAATRSGHKVWRVANALAAALTFIGIFLTGSRGGLIALLAGLVAMVWTSPHRSRSLSTLLLPVVGVALAMALAPEGVNDRVSQDSSSSGRTDIWRIGLLSCPQYCLQGSGWATFADVHEERLLQDPGAAGVQQRFEAHSIWLSTLVEGGVIALALLIAGLALTWRQTASLPPAARGTPRAALVGLMVAGSLLSTFSFKYFWLVLIYVAVVHRFHQRQRADASLVARTEGTSPRA